VRSLKKKKKNDGTRVQESRTLAAALDEISLGDFLQVVEEGL
jgi:hypothetical protein